MNRKSPANPRSDTNGDGVVDVKDLVLVATHFGENSNPAAPSTLTLPPRSTFKAIQNALDLLHAADDGSLTFRDGIANLEQLLALFVPEKMALLHNYPNPFNPETWIPYQLETPADVTICIYTANGVLVQTLDVGHQPAGIYQHRSRAAYWDGHNAFRRTRRKWFLFLHPHRRRLHRYAKNVNTEIRNKNVYDI